MRPQFSVVCIEDDTIIMPIDKDFTIGKFYDMIGNRHFFITYESDYFSCKRFNSGGDGPNMIFTTKEPTTFTNEYFQRIVNRLNALYGSLERLLIHKLDLDDIINDVLTSRDI